jgi:hypothetical protein
MKSAPPPAQLVTRIVDLDWRTVMASSKPRGRCTTCGKDFAYAGMSRHLATCVGEGPALHVAVNGDEGTWWMHLALAPTATLRDLDHFMRATWLECCGHMSAFEIGGTRFDSYEEPGRGLRGQKPRSMNEKANAALDPGTTFSYEYDFGSTTELRGRVLGTVAPGPNKVTLLARNEAITWPCDGCGGAATRVCPYCGALGCRTCKAQCTCLDSWKHETLPVVNSPRMGVCAYTG